MIKYIIFAICLMVPLSALAQLQPRTEERELMPAPDSKKILPHVFLRKTPDGSVVSAHGTSKPGAEPEGYQIEVDEQRGMYKATPVPPLRPGTLLPGGTTEHESWSVGGPPPMPTKEPQSWWRALEPDTASAAWINPGNWWGQVSIVGVDPVRINVCALQSQLSWWVDAWGYMGHNWYFDHLEAVHPTSAGTNWWLDWYNDYGQWWGQWNSVDGWEPCHSAEAQFYNVDFPPGFPVRPYSNRTYLKFKTQICGRTDGANDWWWWWWRGGPSSLLLSALVYHN